MTVQAESNDRGRGSPSYRGAAFPQDLEVTIPFIWGEPFWLNLKLSVDAESDVRAPAISPSDPAYAFARSGSASADFTHTATLRGIQDVQAAGQSVTAWSVASASGTDYRLDFAAPVPEPATSALAMAGLGLLGFMVRRQKLLSAT